MDDDRCDTDVLLDAMARIRPPCIELGPDGKYRRKALPFVTLDDYCKQLRQELDRET